MGILPQAHALVISQLTVLLYPAAIASGLLHVGQKYGGIRVPVWATALVMVVSVPVFHISRARFVLWLNKRKAARLGAVLPPMWIGNSIGNVDILGKLKESWSKGYLSDHLWEQMNTIGPTLALYCLWDLNFITSDANIIKTILATDFTNYVKGEKFDIPMKSVLGTGVFNSDGDLWKFHRSMTRPFFSRDRISHFNIFDRHAEQAIGKIKERLRAGYAFDFQDLVARFTLDSATEFLFGASVHSLGSTLPYPRDAPQAAADREQTPAERFAQAFAEAQLAIAYRARIGWVWPWAELTKSRTTEPMRRVDEFLDPILKEAVRKAQEEKTSGREQKADEIEDDETLLGHLVRLTSDPVILHDEVLNIMIAGRDTTASMLTMTIYFLSQHPDVLKKLRTEILNKVGPSRRPDYDDIRDMKYLRAVINETLRLYPAVPWNVRFAVNDAILPSSDPDKPYFVPAGTPVSYSVHCMHKRKDYWGPDADVFDPDRFIDYRLHKYLTPNPFIFLPFNAGPRICLGQQFAYNEMSFFLIRLLQNFETIEFDEATQPEESKPPKAWLGLPGRKGIEKFWPKAHLTVYSEGGMWVKLGEASSDAE